MSNFLSREEVKALGYEYIGQAISEDKMREGPEVITLEDGSTIKMVDNVLVNEAPVPVTKNFSVTNSPKHHTEYYKVVSEHETKEEALGAMEEDNEVWEFLFSKKARRLK